MSVQELSCQAKFSFIFSQSYFDERALFHHKNQKQNKNVISKADNYSQIFSQCLDGETWGGAQTGNLPASHELE